MPSIRNAATHRTRVLQVMGNAIVGGMETCVTRLIQRLPADQFEVTVLSPQENQLTDMLRGLGTDVYVTPMPDNPSWASIQMTSSIIQAKGVDVIQSHLPNAHLLSGLAGKLTGKPVLATIHGRQISTLDLEVHRLAGTHLNPVCQQSYFHALALGVHASHLHLIPNGVDTQTFLPQAHVQRGKLRKEWNVAMDAPLVGFVGRLSPEKGPEIFLRMALIVSLNQPGTRFVIVGDGPMKADLLRTVERMNLQNVVHFAGLMSDMPQVYSELDMVVSSSRSEAMPLALMEAMASGLPVVATRVGGVPDLVQNGLTGWLSGDGDFESIANNVLNLLAHPEERMAMGHRARDRVMKHFALDGNVKATMQLLNRLAQNMPEARHINGLVNGNQSALMN